MQALESRWVRPVFNGIDGVSGDYLCGPRNLVELRRMIRGERLDAGDLGRQIGRGRAIPQRLREGLDPRRLEEAGWGVIFAEGADPLIVEALEPLMRHRRQQAARLVAERYRQLEGRAGYRPGESKLRFLSRHGMGSGPVDPDRMPYYLLLVGDPEVIPYTFQYQLDVQYAVGRLCFESPDEYARYAETVVTAETGRLARTKRATFFAVRQEGDRATELCHDDLVLPLAERLEREVGDWQIDTVLAQEATRQRLGRLLGGDDTPALLFTACHGLGFDQPHPEQRELQGALVCRKQGTSRVSDDDGPSLFAARDLDPGAQLGGLLAFVFACFGAGTPRHNDFAHRGESLEISEESFVARLPQRLLGHPNGGALAVVGHVDRAWTFSFDWPQAGPQLEVFESTLRRLLAGHPVGSAMEYFDQRYAELECDLANLRSRLGWGEEPDLFEEVGLWTARNDARNFMVLGDPAVRLVPTSAGEIG